MAANFPHGTLGPSGAGPRDEAGLAVSYVPSARVWATVARRRHRDSACDLLAIGVAEASPEGAEPGPPPLPLAEAEARRVRAFFRGPTRLLTGRVTEPQVRQGLRAGCGVVHIAAHSRLDRTDPWGTALLLQRGATGLPSGESDGLLSAREVSRLQLAAPFVALGGCRTGAGEAVPGEGVLGLSRAFLQAGARALLVTLWDVPDTSAYRMAELFYDEAAEGLPVEEALVRSRRRLGSPDDGYAFVLIGDGRLRLEARRPVLPSARSVGGWLSLLSGLTLATVAWRLGRLRGR